ncbi:DUF1877 family protein [Dongia sp.]|uniref:DUF1877 family protein n=1 Tax=Dongia sp. TaxID=1977262 RepID=UPI003752A737
MVFEMQAVTARQIEAMHKDPRLADAVFALSAYDKNPKQPFDEPLSERLDLDKSWAILNFLFDRAAPPFNSTAPAYSCDLLSGASIGEPKDYGPLGLWDVEDTKELAAYLKGVTWEQLLAHFDSQEMWEADTYMVEAEDIGDEIGERELREYASSNFQALRNYVLKAAEAGNGLLAWVG